MMGDRFDKRLVERRLRQGVITEEEVARHLKELRDVASQSTRVEAKLEPVNFGRVDEDDDEDDEDDEDED